MKHINFPTTETPNPWDDAEESDEHATRPTNHEVARLIQKVQALTLHVRRLKEDGASNEKIAAKERALEELRWQLAVAARRAAIGTLAPQHDPAHEDPPQRSAGPGPLGHSGTSRALPGNAVVAPSPTSTIEVPARRHHSPSVGGPFTNREPVRGRTRFVPEADARRCLRR
jgi:hypothetical protein